MPVLRDASTLSRLVRETISRRRARARWERHLAATDPGAGTPPQVLVHFADSMVNAYQLRQWYDPLTTLAQTYPVAVLTRDVTTAATLLDECPLPVLHADTVFELEALGARLPVGIVFYVNQNARNFQMLRAREPAHVFISHGESDKDYMASNQLKAYDYVFVAGRAAEERITARLVDFDAGAHLVQVGRPQVDVHPTGPVLPRDARTVVLYAPTWEGDRASMAYSSLGTHAGPLLDALLASGTHRVIYRPHPRTGEFDHRAAEHDAAVRERLERANRADPSARHLIDTSPAFGWQLTAADVCICDISAIAFDWLATGRPLVLTQPADPRAAVDPDGLPGLVPTMSVADAPRVLELLDEMAEPAMLARNAAIVERYFGDVTPGASMRRFVAASSGIVERRLADRRSAAT